MLACNANAVIGRVMRKQRHRCCVFFRFECLHGAFSARKHASIKTTQHPWRCFRAHSADRVASLRSATLPCKQRNRDAVYYYWRRSGTSRLLHKRWNRNAVCPLKLSCWLLLFMRWVKNNNKYFPINIHCASNSSRADARAVRPYMPLVSNSSYHSS